MTRRVTHGVWELIVQDKKLRDALRSEIDCVYLAVGLEGSKGLEQSNPVKIVYDPCLSVSNKIFAMRVEQRGGLTGALDEAPNIHELPALVTGHRRLGKALEDVNALFDRAE